MKNPETEGVRNFLAAVREFDAAQFGSLVCMREIILDAFPKARERMMYGGILFSLNGEDFSGLFTRKQHISLEFSKGYLMQDPEYELEGKGKFRRHLKIRREEDITAKNVVFYVKQAI